MQKSQINSATLAAATLAATVALISVGGSLAWLASLAGLVLILVLFAYDQEGYRSISQSVAFAAVCGFCGAVACGVLFQIMAANGEVHLANGQWSTKWMPITFAFATAVFWGIDRVRMNTRETEEMKRARRAVANPQGFIPRTAPVAATAFSNPVAATEPEPIATQPERPPAAPAFVAPAATAFSEPAASTFAEPPGAAVAAPSPALVSVPAGAAVATELPRPTAIPIIPRPGSETTIYVNLVGEGMNLLRSVQAEHVGRDFYRITEETPEGEQWEYQRGQVVRCKKKNLSSGKALVAVEEAPRAQ